MPKALVTPAVCSLRTPRHRQPLLRRPHRRPPPPPRHSAVTQLASRTPQQHPSLPSRRRRPLNTPKWNTPMATPTPMEIILLTVMQKRAVSPPKERQQRQLLRVLLLLLVVRGVFRHSPGRRELLRRYSRSLRAHLPRQQQQQRMAEKLTPARQITAATRQCRRERR